MSRAHRRERRPRRRSGFAAAAIFSLSSETHLPLWVFPSARKECTREPEKNLKSRISRWPRGESSRSSERKEAHKAWQGKKKPHPAVERTFCSSVIQGAAGITI